MKKLPDNIVCRRLLNRQKMYRKNIRHTTLSISMFKIDNRAISSVVDITYNGRTDHVIIGYDFKYKNRRMLSKPKSKIKCNTEYVKRFLQEQRKFVSHYNKYIVKHKRMTNRILKVDNKQLSSYTDVSYNINTHTIGIDTYFWYMDKVIFISNKGK